MSIAEEIKAKLGETGELSSADVQRTQAGIKEPKKKKVEAALNEDSTADVSDLKMDPVADTMRKSASLEEEAQPAKDELAENAYGPGLGYVPTEEVEVTKEDKQAYLDAITGASPKARFVRPFTLFGGAVTGSFQSRSILETEALVGEVNRQWLLKETQFPGDYSNLIRKAMLRFSLVEVNHVKIEPVTGELKAVAKVVNNEEIIEAPKWFEEMDVFFNNYQEGITQALINELLYFEKVYWTLNNSAGDANFWNPDEPTTK